MKLQNRKDKDIKYIQRKNNPKNISQGTSSILSHNIRLHSHHFQLTRVRKAIGTKLNNNSHNNPEVVSRLIQIRRNKNDSSRLSNPVIINHFLKLTLKIFIIFLFKLLNIPTRVIFAKFPSKRVFEISAAMIRPPSFSSNINRRSQFFTSLNIFIITLRKSFIKTQVIPQAIFLFTSSLSHH